MCHPIPLGEVVLVTVRIYSAIDSLGLLGNPAELIRNETEVYGIAWKCRMQQCRFPEIIGSNRGTDQI